MSNLLLWLGRVSGGLGALAFALALVGRVTGTWTIAGIQIGTVLQLAIAAMVLACLAYCADVAERSRR